MCYTARASGWGNIPSGGQPTCFFKLVKILEQLLRVELGTSGAIAAMSVFGATPSLPRNPATVSSSSLSRARDTAQEHPFDVLILYPHHPRAGERVVVVRVLQYGGSAHFVIDQPDGRRALLPVWMTEPWAAQLAIVKTPG
ncbi:MAG: hypothetical protein JO266_02405 [Acidobacteria bacterium]|nr:hypothetical protein [Acidobacteriota bacterium]